MLGLQTLAKSGAAKEITGLIRTFYNTRAAGRYVSKIKFHLLSLLHDSEIVFLPLRVADGLQADFGEDRRLG